MTHSRHHSPDLATREPGPPLTVLNESFRTSEDLNDSFKTSGKPVTGGTGSHEQSFAHPRRASIHNTGRLWTTGGPTRLSAGFVGGRR